MCSWPMFCFVPGRSVLPSFSTDSIFSCTSLTWESAPQASRGTGHRVNGENDPKQRPQTGTAGLAHPDLESSKVSRDVVRG